MWSRITKSGPVRRLSAQRLSVNRLSVNRLSVNRLSVNRLCRATTMEPGLFEIRLTI
jgi:hypothetical protein